MVQQFIAVLLVFMLSGMAAPAFAGDEGNAKSLPQSVPLAPASSTALPPVTAFRLMPGALAFAMPQSSQPQEPPASQPQTQPASQPQTPLYPNQGQTTSGAMKWGGIVLMIGGGAMLARGAAIKDPCSGYGPGYICTSNYQEVRAASLAVGAVALVAGVVLFLRRHH